MSIDRVCFNNEKSITLLVSDKVMQIKREFTRNFSHRISNLENKLSEIALDVNAIESDLNDIESEINFIYSINQAANKVEGTSVRLDKSVLLKPTVLFYVKKVSIVKEFGIVYAMKIEPIIKELQVISAAVRAVIYQIRFAAGLDRNNEIGIDPIIHATLEKFRQCGVEFEEEIERLYRIHEEYSEIMYDVVTAYKGNAVVKREMEKVLVNHSQELVDWCSVWMDYDQEEVGFYKPFCEALSKLNRVGSCDISIERLTT